VFAGGSPGPSARLVRNVHQPERACFPPWSPRGHGYRTIFPSSTAGDERQGLRPFVLVPPSDRDPPLGLDLIVNPDGTTTAWNKDKTKVLHSHGPPARAG
jgi:hypothetical protein